MILEGETLYSWCATTHLMSCRVSSASTSLALLGCAHGMRQHDVPVAVSRLPLARGSSSSELLALLRAHSIAGYYLPFLSSSRQDALAKAALSLDSPLWRRQVSGASRCRPASHPLKSCRQCTVDDLHELGRPFWRVALQAPTAWICPTHQRPLSVIGPSGKRWVLPHQSQPPGSDRIISSGSVEAAVTLAGVGAALYNLDLIEMTALRNTALRRLQHMGIIHSLVKASHDRLAQWFQSTTVSRVCGEVEQLQQYASGEWIPALLWRKKLDVAIRWVILWAALAWSSSGEAVQTLLAAAKGELLGAGEQRTLFDGVDRSTTTPERVKDAFAKHDSYAEVMLALQVSRADVTRWLDRDPQLRRQWKMRLVQGRQQRHIDNIKNAVSRLQIVTRQDLEEYCLADIRWLRDHAPTLLNGLLRSVPSRGSPQLGLFCFSS